MRKIKKIVGMLLLLMMTLLICPMLSHAENIVELNLGETQKVMITDSFARSPVWQSSNANVVRCTGGSSEAAEDPFERIYTCDFIGQSPGQATVTVIDEFSGSTIRTFNVIVSKYNAVQCAGVKFKISVSSTVNQIYTISCPDGTLTSCALVGTSSISIGSYARYTKTYAVSIEELGEHTLVISGSTGELLTYHVNMVAHDWGSADVVTPATCINPGIRHYTCTRCQTSREEEISALGHEYESLWSVDTEATCVAPGVQSRHCKRCSERTDIKEIPIIEHYGRLGNCASRELYYRWEKG